MGFFAPKHRTDPWPDRPLGAPVSQEPVQAGVGVPPRPRLVKRRDTPAGSRAAGWLLALGLGAVLAMLAVVVMQDPRSVGAQIDGAIASVRNVGDQAGQRVADSQNAAAEASRQVVTGVGTAIDDAGITAKIKAALAVDPALSAARIDVQTERGIVRLSGPAPDPAARERASVLASAPDGVRGVDNRLTLPQPGSVATVAAAGGVASQPAP